MRPGSGLMVAEEEVVVHGGGVSWAVLMVPRRLEDVLSIPSCSDERTHLTKNELTLTW